MVRIPVNGVEMAQWQAKQALDLGVGDPEPGAQRPPAAGGEHGEHPRRRRADPRDHDVGVGVVVDPVIGPVRVAGVELVGTDDAADHVSLLGVVELGPAHPEPRDLGEHLGAVDDVLIDASAETIDGVGGVLGRAGPDAIRAGAIGARIDFLPVSDGGLELRVTLPMRHGRHVDLSSAA